MLSYNINDIKITKFVWKTIDSNSYLLNVGNSGILVDAIDSLELYKAIENLDNVIIILTHGHFDHICGLNRIRELKQEIIVYATEQCSYNIGNKYRNLSSSANAIMSFYNDEPFSGDISPIICNPVDYSFHDECFLRWKNHRIFLKSVYGHSNDGLVMLLDDKYLFSGDTLLAIPTVTRFPGGSTKRFWQEDIPTLKKLAVEIVYPGHGEPGKFNSMLEANVQPEKYK